MQSRPHWVIGVRKARQARTFVLHLYSILLRRIDRSLNEQGSIDFEEMLLADKEALADPLTCLNTSRRQSGKAELADVTCHLMLNTLHSNVLLNACTMLAF